MTQETRRLVVAAVAVTAAIGLLLTWLRAGVEPYGVGIFRHLLFFQDYYSVPLFAAVLVAALAAPVRRLGAAAAALCGERPGAVAALTTLACAAGAWLVYRAEPLSMDEYAALFQGRVFAQGQLAARLPPGLLDWLIAPWMGEFFRIDRSSAAVAAGYWPGFALLLTPFAKLGVPWLLNPLIGGATVLVMHRLALALFEGERGSAGYVVLLTIASPAVTFTAFSFYSMPAHLLANALFVLLLVRPGAQRAFLAGIAGSVALVLHNPVPHLLFALPWVGWLAWRREWRLLGALAAGYLPLSLALGWGWALFADRMSAAAAASAASAAPGGPLGFLEALLRRLGYLAAESRTDARTSHLLSLAKLWLWAAPALVAVAALGAWRQRGDRGAWLVMGMSALLTYLAYFLVRFDQGHGWGARYFHSAWLVVPLFAASALKFSSDAKNLSGYVAGCALLGLVVLTPFQGLQAERYIARHLAQLPSAGAGEARVLIIDPRVGYFNWDLAQNDPFLRNPVLRLTSRGPAADAAMMAAQFPQYRLLGADLRGAVWGLPPP
jgi:hypothetical protein